MASIHEILRPQTLTRVVSQVAASNSTLLQFFGMQPGGPNERYFGHGREGSYHVFNNVRSIGLGRAPGTAAGRRARRPVGRVPFVYPRMHEQIDLLAEELHNLARIEDPTMRDEAGRDYIKMQTRPISQRSANWRTGLLVGMLRDSLYIHEDGDDWYFTYTSASSLQQIDFQLPAGNQNQLDMLGAGDIIDTSWDNPGANIPLHCLKINAAFQQLCGGRLTDVFVRGATWNNITSNDYVAAGAGLANAPFQTFERQVGTGPDGTPINEYVGRINSIPGVTWHITDDGLELGVPGSETFTHHIGANSALFLVGPNDFPDLYTMYLGSEPIAEYDGGPESVKIGLASWSVKRSNPTRTELFGLDNALPVSHVPNARAYGTVIF